MFLIEEVPGFDMRLKVQGDPVKLIEMLQGAMTVEPSLADVFRCAVELLPVFKQCIKAEIRADFNGNHHQ